MLEPVSVGLKFGFLAVLYLFLLWVARSALKDLRRGAPAAAARRSRRPTRPACIPASQMAMRRRRAAPRGSWSTRCPGSRYDITDGATLGRGDVEIVLEDPFASSRHASSAGRGRSSSSRTSARRTARTSTTSCCAGPSRCTPATASASATAFVFDDR